MRRPKWIDIAVVGLVVIGVVDFTRRSLKESSSPALEVSKLTSGSRFPSLEVAALDEASARAGLPRSGCRAIVVFSTRCPHCRVAAVRDVENTSANRIPVAWIASAQDSVGPEYRKYVRSDSPMFRFVNDSVATAQLLLKAVPAVFLVGPDETVRRVSVFTGQENHAQLREDCA